MRRRCRFAALIALLRVQRPRFLALFAVCHRPQRVSGQSARAVDGLRPEQILQPSHVIGVIGQVHQSDLHRRPHLALGPHQDVTLARALIAEHMLDTGTDLRPPVVGRLFPFVQRTSTAALAVEALCSKRLFAGL